MENLMIKTKKRREVRNSKPHEIYLENGDAPFDAMDNWLCAERELNGYYE